MLGASPGPTLFNATEDTMGDMADWVNDDGLEASCYEQTILDRGEPIEMFEAGLIDERGFVDARNPPGLIGFCRDNVAKLHSYTECPCCGGKLVSRTNKKTGAKFTGCAEFPRCKFSH